MDGRVKPGHDGGRYVAQPLLNGVQDTLHETHMASHSIFAAAALLAALGCASTAQAGDYANASTYNAPFGLQPGSENAPPNTSMRDANGNLTVVNGQFTSANFGTSAGASASGSGAGMAYAGAGTSGASATQGTATAIGNQLNVVTLGSNNTVVVNATQTNNGNQTATNTVNGH